MPTLNSIGPNGHPPLGASRRERRIALRQEQILEAAATIFSQHGYERATTREIAAAADVSEGTLYNYFANKRELLIGVARAYGDEVAGGIASIEADNFEDMVTQLLTNRFRNGRERRLFMLFLSESRLNPDVHQYYVAETLTRIVTELENRISDLIARGIMRSVDPAIAARTLSATIMGYAALFELGGPIWEGLETPNSGKSSNHAFAAEVVGAKVADIFLHGLQAKGSQS